MSPTYHNIILKKQVSSQYFDRICLQYQIEEFARQSDTSVSTITCLIGQEVDGVLTVCAGSPSLCIFHGCDVFISCLIIVTGFGVTDECVGAT